MIAVGRIKTSKEEKCARRGTLYVEVALTSDFSHLHEQHARYVAKS